MAAGFPHQGFRAARHDLSRSQTEAKRCQESEGKYFNSPYRPEGRNCLALEKSCILNPDSPYNSGGLPMPTGKDKFKIF
jgi:hypothetical protein